MKPFLLAFPALLLLSPLASATLPRLKVENWIGFFQVHLGKNYQFSISEKGTGSISVLGRKGTPVSRRLAMEIEFVIEEQLSDGRVFSRIVEQDSLTSDNPASMKLDSVVMKGTVQGGATFEAYISEDKGAILLGGRITDPGTLSRNPIKFAVRVKQPDAYPYDTGGEPPRDGRRPAAKPADDDGDKDDRDGKSAKDKDRSKDPDKSSRDRDNKNANTSGKTFTNADDPKSLAEKMKDDRIQLLRPDGKRTKPSTNTPLGEESIKELNGPGISGVELLFSSYQEKSIILGASPNSSIRLAPYFTTGEPAPIYRGCYFSWSPDPAKDPESKARLKIEVK